MVAPFVRYGGEIAWGSFPPLTTHGGLLKSACLDTCGVCPFFRSQQSYSRACVDLGAQWPMTCGGDEGFLFFAKCSTPATREKAEL